MDNGEDMMNFADMLDAYDYGSPQRGQITRGVVLEVTEGDIIVDIGAKRDAFVPRADLEKLGPDVLKRIVPGAEVSVYVLQSRSQEGELLVSISKALEEDDWERSTALLQNGEHVRGRVVAVNKGGVLVTFGRIRGFVPNSHLIDVPRTQDKDALDVAKEELMGRTLTMRVIDIDRQRNRLVLSERAAQQQARSERLKELHIGDVIEGEVVSLMPYGAFIDIGGIDGLIHISEMDWQFVETPGDVLAVGEHVKVRVEEIDLAHERISLSRKAVLPDPWQNVAEAHTVGELVSAHITNLVDFGAFVMLPSGVVGLLHISRMSRYNPSHPSEVVQKGDEVLVRVIEINPEERQIALSLDDVTEEELAAWWAARGYAAGAQPQQPDEMPDEIPTE